jgi:hypothetical protein
MTRTSRSNLLFYWVVFAAVVFATSTAARAGCSHPWVKTNDATSSIAELAELSSNDQTDHFRPGFPAPAKHPNPCAHGGCSQPFGYPPSSTLEMSGRTDLWGDLTLQSPPRSRNAIGFYVEQGCDRPRRSNSPIERPPRCITVR